MKAPPCVQPGLSKPSKVDPVFVAKVSVEEFSHWTPSRKRGGLRDVLGFRGVRGVRDV